MAPRSTPNTTEMLNGEMKEVMIAIGIQDHQMVDAMCKEVCARVDRSRPPSIPEPHAHSFVLQILAAMKKVALERSNITGPEHKRFQVKNTNSVIFRALAERKSRRGDFFKKPSRIIPEADCEDLISAKGKKSKLLRSAERAVYDIFLRFRDPTFMSDERHYDYISFKRSDFYLVLTLGIIFIGAAAILARLYFPSSAKMYEAELLTLVTILFFCISAIWTAVLVFIRVASVSFEYNITCMQRYHDWAITFMKSRKYGQIPEDACVVNGALFTGMYLLSRVVGGQCPEENTFWNNKNCNPDADSLPPEALALALICLPLSQSIIKGASKFALLLSWFISALFINISMGIAEYHGGFLWINVFLFFQGFVSYEFERATLRHFIKSVQVIETMGANADLQLKVANYQAQENERALEAKRSLVRHISHEIRTPLNIVCVGTDVLIKELRAMNADGRVPEAILEVIEGIEGASSTALEVVNDLLMFEKIAAGMNTLECVPVALVPFVRKAMKPHALSARAKDVCLDLVLGDGVDEGTMAVNVGPVKMTTVLRNLFSNAIKFSPTGGRVIIKLTAEAEAEGEGVVLSVKDEGPGLSAINIQRLFQEGVQFDANKLQKGGGSGLGLFITKGIVTQHEGAKIWAESEGEGKGCTFFVRLLRLPAASLGGIPLMHAPSSRSERVSLPTVDDTLLRRHAIDELEIGGAPLTLSPSRPDVTMATSRNKRPLNILVVDDSHANRKMIVRGLKAKGHRCFQAADGLEALGHISRAILKSDCESEKSNRQVDVVLMDNNMPRMCGPEAAREMRKMGFEGPIIGITGDNEGIDFLGAGANKVLVKPVKIDELMEIIAAAMDAPQTDQK